MTTTILGLLAFLCLFAPRSRRSFARSTSGCRRRRITERGRCAFHGRMPTRPDAANPAPAIPPPGFPRRRIRRCFVSRASPLRKPGTRHNVSDTWHRGHGPWYAYRSDTARSVIGTPGICLDDGWQEEPGHDAVSVFQRARTLLWLRTGAIRTSGGGSRSRTLTHPAAPIH